MKRLLLIVAFLALSIRGFCQENDFGKIVKDTLLLNNGAKFIVGQKLKLGYGSSANKNFEFIHLSPWSLAGPEKLKSQWANYEMTIKGFKLEGTKKTGKNFIIVLGGGNLSPYWCEVEAAMDNGEVIVEGVNDKKTLSRAAAPAAYSSPADELKKLKGLLDAGAITQGEYDSTKKKILARM